MTATAPYAKSLAPISRLRKCFYLACLLVLCLLCLEGFARLVFFIRPPQSDAEMINANIAQAYPGVPLDSILEQSAKLRLRFAPYLVVSMEPDQHTEYFTINALGFRGKQPQLPKPEGTYRILVMGGSVAFGYLSTGDNTALPAQLERALGERLGLQRVEVFNCGVIGYNSGQELILYTQKLRALQADLIVVVNGFNDLFNYASSQKVGWPAHADYLANSLHHVQTLQRERPFPWRNLKEYAVERSALLQWLRSWRKTQATPHAIDTSDTTIGEIANFYANNMRQLALLAQRDGARVAIVLQPINGLGAKSYTPYEKESVDVMGRYFTNYCDYMNSGHAAMVGELNKLQVETGALCIDSTTFLDEYPQGIYYDICHITDEGNALLADRIATVLIEHSLTGQ